VDRYLENWNYDHVQVVARTLQATFKQGLAVKSLKIFTILAIVCNSQVNV
jgi:hypothetical protein